MSDPMSRGGPLVLGIGEILWDLLPGGKQLGGAPANFAYHAQALGGDAVVVSAVGRDALGEEVLSRLDGLGMDREFVEVLDGWPTGTVAVEVDEKGVPTFTIQPEVAWDYIPQSPELLELARRAEAICFGSLAQRSAVSRSTIRAVLGAAGGGCWRVFDVNLRQAWYSREVIHESLLLADVLKLNDHELPMLGRLLEVGVEEEETIAGLFMGYPMRLIAMTRGDTGSRLYYPNGRFFDHEGYPAEVVDTVGAGDAFTAALTMGLLRGEQPDDLNDRANRLASYVCSQGGATPAVPADLFENR